MYKAGRGVIKTPIEKVHFLVKLPHELIDEHPIEYFPGFSDGINGSDRLTSAYAEAGRVAVTLSYPRSNNPEFKDDLEGHKVHSGLLVLDGFRSLFPNLGKADAEGHSEGAANASRACLESQDEFRTLVVMGAGGLIKGDSQRKIMMRAVKNPQTFVRTTGHFLSHPRHALSLGMYSADYFWRNPSKAVHEAARIASADIRPRFPVLSKKSGIPNGALQFQSDSLFPLAEVMASTDDGNIFDIFSIYPFPDASHITPQNHPRTVATQVLEMTTKLAEIADQKNAAA